MEDTDKSTYEKIFEIITPVAIQGDQDVPEPKIIFDDSIIENPILTEQTLSNVSVLFDYNFQVF